MSPDGFEPTISVGKRPQTLDHAATGAGSYISMPINIILSSDERNCSEKLYILYVLDAGSLNNRSQLRNISDNEVGFKHKETCLLRFQSVVEALLLGFFEPPVLSLAVSP